MTIKQKSKDTLFYETFKVSGSYKGAKLILFKCTNFINVICKKNKGVLEWVDADK